MRVKLYIFLSILPWLFLTRAIAQEPDAWIQSQLGDIRWKASYKGVLAEYHPITVHLFSDKHLVAGYLTHEGDKIRHKLIGDWSDTQHFQLQERDQHDRLAGYVSGQVTTDKVDMQWMSADKSRIFSIKAFPEKLIRVNSVRQVHEWVVIPSSPAITISVQKMEYGVLSGIAARENDYVRFEGYCLDGTCSIWNTVLHFASGPPVTLTMQQRDPKSYKAKVLGTDYNAPVSHMYPMKVKRFDNSVGFLDFVYPDFGSPEFQSWIDTWVNQFWPQELNYLQTMAKRQTPGRLVHRSSGWMELFEITEDYISGLITYLQPGEMKRVPFVWYQKDKAIILQREWFNTPDDAKSLSSKALTLVDQGDEEYADWIRTTGFNHFVPTRHGLVACTRFDMIYGDAFQFIPNETARAHVNRKASRSFYW